MRLLDLFCGAGGAAMGYYRSGYQDIVGVDIEDQPNYPFTFIKADALDFPMDGFDAVHASPPCQLYMRSGVVNKSDKSDLLDPTRQKLRLLDIPWVIENVPGAPMRPDYMLCGSMFKLNVRRHRLFETNWATDFETPPCDHSLMITGVYGRPHGPNGAASGMLPSDLQHWSVGMGIDWMTVHELSQAIPPAYTEFVGARMRVATSVYDLPSVATHRTCNKCNARLTLDHFVIDSRNKDKRASRCKRCKADDEAQRRLLKRSNVPGSSSLF